MGIYQSDIMKELQIAQPDMIDYYYKYKDQYNIREGQFQEDETDFCQSFFWAVLAHYGHHISYQYYNDDFYLEQIKKGNIHPDDLGYLIDFKHWNSNKETILAAANKGEFFGKLPASTPITDVRYYIAPTNTLNAVHQKFYLAPLEVEMAKARFMKKYGLQLTFGNGGSRI